MRTCVHACTRARACVCVRACTLLLRLTRLKGGRGAPRRFIFIVDGGESRITKKTKLSFRRTQSAWVKQAEEKKKRKKKNSTSVII